MTISRQRRLPVKEPTGGPGLDTQPGFSAPARPLRLLALNRGAPRAVFGSRGRAGRGWDCHGTGLEAAGGCDMVPHQTARRRIVDQWAALRQEGGRTRAGGTGAAMGASAAGSGRGVDDRAEVTTHSPTTDEVLTEDELGGAVAPDGGTKLRAKKRPRAARRPVWCSNGAAFRSGVANGPRPSGHQDHAGEPAASARGWFA